jgi:hypothetical protein
MYDGALNYQNKITSFCDASSTKLEMDFESTMKLIVIG